MAIKKKSNSKQAIPSTRIRSVLYNIDFNLFNIPDELPLVNGFDFYYLEYYPELALFRNNGISKERVPETEINELFKNNILFVDVSRENWKEELINFEGVIEESKSYDSIQIMHLNKMLKVDLYSAISYIRSPKTILSLFYKKIHGDDAKILLSSALDAFRLKSKFINSKNLPGLSNKSILNEIGQSVLNGYEYYVLNPIREFNILRKNGIRNWENPLFRFSWFMLLAFSLIYLVLGGINAGISSDEFRYLNQAKKVYNFYSTLGKDTSAIVQVGIDPQHYNGQVYDNLLFVIGKVVGLENNFVFRHIFIALLGWLSILITSKLALRILDYKLAVFSLVFMLCSPNFIGNCFNNNRDIPLVTGIMLSIYSIYRLNSYFPNLNIKYLGLTSLGIFISGGHKFMGGVITLLFIGLLMMVILYNNRSSYKKFIFNSKVIRWIIGVTGACLIGVGFTIIVWPFGLISPFKNLLEVVQKSGNLSAGFYQIFEGKYLLSSKMPNYYLIKYIFISIPVGLWVGVGFCLVSLFRSGTKDVRSYILFFLFCFTLPIIYSFVKLHNLYGSWRLFLFLFPFITLLGAFGWYLVFNFKPFKRIGKYQTVLLILILIHPILFSFRNHPYQYMYYNEILGGTRGAYGNYELDYSLNSLKQGSQWLKKYIRDNHAPGTKLVIATNGSAELSYYFRGFDDSISVIYTRYYERGAQNWDYAIFPNMYIHPFQLKNHIFPKADSLHTIKIDGKPLCFIYKRNSRDDFEAMQAVARNDANLAVQKLNAYLRHNPKSEWAWFQLAYLYAQNNNWPQAQNYLNESMKYHPEFLPSRMLQGMIHYNTGKTAEAKVIFNKLVNEKFDLANTSKWAGMVYEKEGDYRKALEQYGLALGAGNKQKDLYSKVANCLRQLGDASQAAKYESMAR